MASLPAEPPYTKGRRKFRRSSHSKGHPENMLPVGMKGRYCRLLLGDVNLSTKRVRERAAEAHREQERDVDGGA